MDNNSLAYTKWDCNITSYSCSNIVDRLSISKSQWISAQPFEHQCARKGIEIIEAAAIPDHIYLYVSIPPKYSISEIVGYLKGKSGLMIFVRHANLKYRYGNRHFWCRRYYVDTVGGNEKTIKEYVCNQLQEDIATDQLSIKEFNDPFTDEPVIKDK